MRLLLNNCQRAHELRTLLKGPERSLPLTEVVAVVCDCLAANVAVAKLLGCHVHEHTFANLKTFFPHPNKEDEVIFFLLDACHALKLLRNLLGDKGVLLSATYGTVLWKHIKALQELQEKEGLCAANKLTKAHIAYYQQPSGLVTDTDIVATEVHPAHESTVAPAEEPHVSAQEEGSAAHGKKKRNADLMSQRTAALQKVADALSKDESEDSAALFGKLVAA
ncbi:hypothetical protein MTO96_030264 [Rhipicephalus appendiculatus]